MQAQAPQVSRLPAELTLKVMEYLSQRDLRAASELSTEFYGLALASGLYIERTVFLTPSSDCGEMLAQLDRLLDHAASKPALNLSIRARFRASVERGSPPLRGVDSLGEAVDRFLASVQRAMPYLVRLQLSFAGRTPESVYRSLCEHAAPRLRELDIEHCMDNPQAIPHDIFKGNAPLLRKISLSLDTSDPLLLSAHAEAFQHVTHLKLFIVDAQHCVRLAQIFPSLQVLDVNCPRSNKARNIDLSGSRLRFLALAGGTGLLTDSSVLEAIPIVEHRTDGIDSVWPSDDKAICAYAERPHGVNAAISFGPRDGGWRRTIALVSLDVPDKALPLSEIASHLVSLTLDKSLVNALIQAPVVLTALRELFLDISANGINLYCWPPVHAWNLGLRVHFDELTPSVRCPALARVVIFAIPSGHPITVVPTKATRLGRALGLRDGRETKPMLTLAGCTFVTEPIWPALEELFATVEVVASTGDRIPEYYRTCRYISQNGDLLNF
ncbi:hypothetical protein AURDEDRAFT_176071 [Auricularia subglabra TFB-10046 SS5]|nr:hypothetical protein AURDEDRAFT_176071 [Auricularia subglabra TFB-10046 SS5]